MASPMIELHSVSMSFSNEGVLKNINLTIEKGEIFVLAGPSGEGKSVLLKVMAGLLSPTIGQVVIEGQDFYGLESSARDEVRRKMGMLFQNNALFDSLTAGENIGFPLVETTNLPQESITNKIQSGLEAVGLAHAINLFPDEISGGMQKRLGIARAIALNPDLIYYDDPTAGLDPITSKKIVELIISLNEKNGTTTVAITNDMNRAYQMADRMGFLFDGELIVTGTPTQTKQFKDARVQQFITGSLRGPLTESV